MGISKEQEILIYDDLYYNVSGTYLFNQNKKAFLTLTESRILSFLIKNLNSRVYAYDIADYLNHFSTNVTEQNVYVYINRLRKKISLINKNHIKFLKNLRPGYILVIIKDNDNL